MTITFEPASALLIIDMLNDFIEDGGALVVPEAKRIVPRLAKILAAARDQGVKVIFVTDSHREDDHEFRWWPAHAVSDTWGGMVVDDLRPIPGEYIVPKRRYSAFFGTDLDTYLREMEIQQALPDRSAHQHLCLRYRTGRLDAQLRRRGLQGCRSLAERGYRPIYLSATARGRTRGATVTGVTADPSRPRWRLLSLPPASGARNMALDQALLECASAAGFRPTMRFYRWSPPALSIGRFQPADEVDLDRCASEGIDVVRRPTGGKSILHLDDFTYSIVIPRGYPLPDSVVEAYSIICGGILRALEHLGVDAAMQSRKGDDYRSASGACFAASTQADLEYDGRKLCGSAQVRRQGALLQHGSILLSDHAELLFKLLRFRDAEDRERHLRDFRVRCMALDDTGCHCSWSEIADSFRRGFADSFQVGLEEGGLSIEENRLWDELAEAYTSRHWLYNPESRAFPR